ncbi:MAG: hypothetical protein HN919_15315 [Verrucomicrobia bacterium]|jgi:hypothetical protein|nr:hypothetical protein [Verrucomicrobiota bacterium]MBT7067667.1 hypothetical protein [Verrucomicrobiota bacterium]MBT7701457.1 hypothetical protein [Verrucomicrobiota bacterium]
MKRAGLIGFTGMIAVAVAMGIFGAGCDTVTDATGVITVDQPLMTVTGAYALVITVTDTNASLYLPLEWSVSDRALGSVTGQGGLTALYEGNAVAGINTITVRDQADAVGFGVVNHVPANGIAITPISPDVRGAGRLVQFSVTQDAGLVLPLIWAVSNPALGTFSSSSGYDAVYVSTGALGSNIITVRDQMGASATAIADHF